MAKLTPKDHSRDSARLTYVYPVMSRRAGGLSIGINLNPNNACNWRCIYCQVPDLTRGAAPSIDLARLRGELAGLLAEAISGEFFQRYDIPVEQRVIRDIAMSGNGEPTSAREFSEVIEVIGQVCATLGLNAIHRVLITNGSRVALPAVNRALRRWAELDGEVWFKLDRATTAGIERVNSVSVRPETVLARLMACAAACPTWIQASIFQIDGTPPDAAEQAAYLVFLRQALDAGVSLRGIKLYGLARQSFQPEAPRLSNCPVAFVDAWADQLRALGLTVQVSY